MRARTARRAPRGPAPLLAALAALTACGVWPPGPDAGPPARQVTRYLLQDEDGAVRGHARVGPDEAGRRVERLEAELEGPDPRLEAAIRGTPDAPVWQGRWEQGGRVGRLEVAQRDGIARTTARVGLEVTRTQTPVGAVRPLWPQSLSPSTPAVGSALLWEGLARRLAGVEETADLEAIDPRRGRPVTLRAELRERAEVPLGGERVAARRLFVSSPATGRTLWVADDGRLLAVWPAVQGLRLVREGVRLPEPREPRRPAGVTEEEVRLPGDGVRLAGTVSRPAGGSRPGRPGVLLLHGSGPMDRDEAPFMIFRDLAWRLAEAGYPVVRYDKRGVRESTFTGEGRSATLADLTGDARRWLRWMRAHPDLPDCVVPVGHSEGGYLAPMLATDPTQVPGIVLLAGPVDPLPAVMRDQLQLILEAHGATAPELEAARAAQDATFRVILSAAGPPPAMAGLDEAAIGWLRSHDRHDPEAPLRALEVPLLALFGSDDIQVPPTQAQRLRAVLRGGAPATLRVVPGLDHLLMRSDGQPGMGALADPDRRMAPEVADAVVEFLAGVRCGQG